MTHAPNHKIWPTFKPRVQDMQKSKNMGGNLKLTTSQGFFNVEKLHGIKDLAKNFPKRLEMVEEYELRRGKRSGSVCVLGLRFSENGEKES